MIEKVITGTTVFVGCTTFAIADLIFNQRWLFFDKVFALQKLFEIKLDVKVKDSFFYVQ